MSQRLTGGFIPAPVPLVGDPSGAGHDPRSRDLDDWTYYLAQPTIPVNVPTSSSSFKLLGHKCMLVGWSLRDAGGTGAVVELFDGADTTGPLVAEVNLPPLAGLLGLNSDVDIDASSATAASANNVTLAAAVGATTFITGFEITGDGATGASIITITVTGVLGGTKTYFLTIPAGVSTAITPLIVEFSRPIPASALNTAIVVNVPSFGAGNTNAAVTAHGFQRTVLVATAGQPPNGATVSQSGLLVLARGGLFLRVVSGTVIGSVWVRV